MKRDYYEVLGVGREARDEEIKKAYRRLAMEHHPDRNPGDKDAEARFKEATEAYEVLRDGERRARYDQFGNAADSGGAGGPNFTDFDLSDALRTFMRDFGGFGGFEPIFGNMGGSVDRLRGHDLQVRLKLSLEEVLTGVEKRIRLQREQTCDTCEGTGSAGKQRTRCTACQGTGEVRQVRSSFLGQLVTSAPCPRCDGEGEIVENPCLNCKGRGTRPEVTTIAVQVPAGVAEQQYLTLRGQGNAGRRGGSPGDLRVLIEEKPHEIFERDGENLHLVLPVSFPLLALGGSVDVPTLDGPVEVRLAAGTDPAKLQRVRGKGLPRLGSRQRGDLLVRLRPSLPSKLTPREKELLEELAELQKDRLPKPGKSFFERVREAFGA